MKSDTDSTYPVMVEAAYVPTMAQATRAASLRRFNWLFVYLPILLATLIALVLVGILIAQAVFNGGGNMEQTAAFVSGVADMLLLLALVPMLFICLLFPALVFGAIIYGRQEGYAPLKKLQEYIWRLDNLVLKGQEIAEKGAQRAAEPVIWSHSWFAFGRALWQRFIRIWKRS